MFQQYLNLPKFLLCYHTYSIHLIDTIFMATGVLFFVKEWHLYAKQYLSSVAVDGFHTVGAAAPGYHGVIFTELGDVKVLSIPVIWVRYVLY